MRRGATQLLRLHQLELVQSWQCCHAEAVAMPSLALWSYRGLAAQPIQAGTQQGLNFRAVPARSLEWDRPVEQPRPEVEQSRFRQLLLSISGFYSKESQLLRGSKNLFRAITEQAELEQLYAVFGLQKRFAHVHSMMCIHMWMLLVRLRAEGQDGHDIAQMAYENFQHDVELRVRAEGVKVRLSKWLTELEQMFYGMSNSFDKALRGEEDFVDALVRNIYSKDETKRPDAQRLYAYIKRELACLKKTPSKQLLDGRVKFSEDVFRQ